MGSTSVRYVPNVFVGMFCIACTHTHKKLASGSPKKSICFKNALHAKTNSIENDTCKKKEKMKGALSAKSKHSNEPSA